MELNGLQFERHGSGYAVTLRMHVGAKEPMGLWIAGQMAASLNFEAFEAADPGTDEVQDEAPPIDTKSRRKRSAKASNAAAGTDAGEEEKPRGRRQRGKSAGDTDDAAETKGRRRRGPAASTASDESATDEEPKAQTRRRRGKKADAPPTSEAAPSAGRRARGASASTAKSPSDDDVSDEDLTRAASNAASKVGAPAVMDVLEEFAAAQVSDLSQEQRPEFLVKLAELDDG